MCLTAEGQSLADASLNITPKHLVVSVERCLDETAEADRSQNRCQSLTGILVPQGLDTAVMKQAKEAESQPVCSHAESESLGQLSGALGKISMA